MRLTLSMKLMSVILVSAIFVIFTHNAEAAGTTDSGTQMRLVGFCSSCHGHNGVSMGESIPSIAGQTKEYLIISMTEMKDKTRRATLMQKIAQGYNPEDIVHISEYFSKIAPVASHIKADSKIVAKGKKVSEQCADCHADNGKGYEEVPRIAGQHARYLYNAMIEYKDKVRNNDAGGAMMLDAVDISKGDLEAVAEYYSTIK